MDGFFTAQQGCYLKDAGSKFTAYQHKTKGLQQIAWLDRGGGSHLLEFFFQVGGFPYLCKL